MMIPKKPRASTIDKYVGFQLRLRRVELGLTQEKLAEKLEITAQQLQKYENGTNRVSASRLLNISCLLSVPISYFFSGATHEKNIVAEPDEDTSLQQILALYHTLSTDEKTQMLQVLQKYFKK